MSVARTFIALLGAAIAIAGVVLGAYIDKYLGIGTVVVGVFLLILTVTKFSDIE